MTAFVDWAVGAVAGSTVLMLFVLAVRQPVRHWLGARLAYALWALPAIRLIAPPVPADLFGALPTVATVGARLVLAVGPVGSAVGHDPADRWHVPVLLAVWLVGAAVLLGVHIARYVSFRRRLLASATPLGHRGTIEIIATDVEGPLSFGVVRRVVAVPRDFATHYAPCEQDLALAHECAHHRRGDLIANWVSLAMFAALWWNPVAWLAIRAFRDDQEFAVDAEVLTRCDPRARPDYAHVLAKAAGLGALPVCNLTPRSNLKGRLMMLTQAPLSPRRRIVGGSGLAVLAATALAATVSVGSAAAPSGKQAVTIGVKPDGAGSYALLVGGKAVAPGAALPGGATLPSDFDTAGGCDLTASAKPHAMVIKGSGGITTYSVMCASATPAPVRATLAEGLTSLKTMRGSVATQPASLVFPEVERRHALGAIDRSIHEVEATLAKAG